MSLTPLALLLITPHLVSQGRPARSLLPRQYCRGKSFAHFADSDPTRKFPGCCAVDYSLRKQSLWCFLWFCCCRHTVYSSVCPSFQPLSSCVRSWLLCACLFALLHLASCLVFKATIWTSFQSFLFNQRLVFTGYPRLNLNCKQTHLTVEVISNPH